MAFAFALSPLQQQQQQQQTPNPFQQQQQQTPNPFQQQTPNPFQQQTPNPFQQQNNLFLQQQQQQQQQQLQFQLQQQQQQLQQQQQQQQRQTYLFTADKSSASYNTKWADLHPDSQKFLLQIEERILEYRDESQRLDQCSRLYDSSVSNDGFKLDASHIMQELGGISTAMERERVLLQELMTVVKDLMRDTEVAVRSFMMLRPRFLHPNVAPAATQTSGTTTVHNPSTQPISSSILSVVDFYSGLPRRPSPFLEKTVARFEKYLGECQQWIEELEHLLLSNTEGTSSSSDLSLLNSLPKVMSNVHDFFVHVAAKVESLHQYIESMKIAYLADQRCRGDGNDPFLEADRRETAKREAAARRVHPTVHLPAISQPSTQVAGLFASSALPGASTVSQPSVGTSAASSGSGFSFYSTPSSSAPAASTSLFSTPSASAPASTLFGSSSFQPQHSLFGSASTSPLGSTQTPLFGSSTPFSSTPAIGSSPLFSTPSFASGAATGSGASFGATSKSAKPKSRTPRR